MRNILDKICRENQNFIVTFSLNRAVYETKWRFHSNNGYTNVTQCYVRRTLPLLLTCQRLIVRFTEMPLEKSVTSSRDRKLTFQYGRCN
jgi:hypothetical protein